MALLDVPAKDTDLKLFVFLYVYTNFPIEIIYRPWIDKAIFISEEKCIFMAW